MGSRGPRLMIAAAAALLLAACTETGTPVATDPPSVGQPTSGGPTTTPTSARPTAPPVTRPADKDITAVDPCQVARDLRPADFGIARAGDGYGDDSIPFPGSRTCTMTSVDANLILGVDAVVTKGFDAHVGATNGQVARVPVAGYPGAVIRPVRPTSCFAAVDVKDGQMLLVQLTIAQPDRQPPHPQDELCATVPRIAEAAMKVVIGG
ncbi:DUF3558 family protein [Actinokineospora sp.]|uniref:DUF3558 family protein n=1 Tax=Actinokineospora sp. TaxID=1872133 RepID=UPI00403825F3